MDDEGDPDLYEDAARRAGQVRLALLLILFCWGVGMILGANWR